MSTPTRVVVDNQIFSTQRRGGVGRYFAELVSHLRADPQLGVEALTPYRYVLSEHVLDAGLAGLTRPAVPAWAQRPRLLRAVNDRLERRASRDAVVHHTLYFPRNLQVPARAHVCTVYDMIPELFPELVPAAGLALDSSKSRYVRECDAVLCISESTRQDLLAAHGRLDKPVVVTHLGVGEHFFGARPQQADEPYVLFVGQRFAYKNVDVLLRALAAVPGLALRCVGGPELDATELARHAELGLQGRVSRVSATDAEMPGLYASALCLVLPSRYEGFGLPLVEAFAAGCPAVVAQASSLPEVGVDAALYFAPDDDALLADLIGRLRDDPALRRRLVEAGRVRARDFTWRRTAERTAEVYRQL